MFPVSSTSFFFFKMRDLYPCPYRVSSKIKESEPYSKIDFRINDDNIIDGDSDGGDDYYDNNVIII